MREMGEAIAETVRDPQLVVQSPSDATAELFYSYRRATMLGDKWLCVVVKHGGDDAFVLTAYLTDQPKRGIELWRKK